MTTDEFISILNNVPDLDTRLGNIQTVYEKQKELKKNPKYKPINYPKLVSNECPNYLKDEKPKWLSFVVMYNNIQKRIQKLIEPKKITRAKKPKRSDQYKLML